MTVADLSLTTTATGGGTALDIRWPFYHSSIYFHSIIRNVELIGHQRAQSGWTDDIVLTESWQTILDGVDFVGAGQDVSGAAVELRGRSIGNVFRQLLSYHTKDGVVLNGRTEGFRLTQSGFAATTYGLRSGPEQAVIPQVVCHATHASVNGTAVKLRKVDQAYISGCNFWTEVRAPDDHTDPVIALGRPREARLTDNALIAKAGGIKVDGGSRTHVGGNVIKVGNEMAGIRLAHTQNTTVSANQIWTVESGVDGIVVDGGDGIAVVGNTLTGTAEGIRFTDGVDDAIAGFNLWTNPDGEDVGDVVIDEGSNTLVAQNLRSWASEADDGIDGPEDGPAKDDEADALPGFGAAAAAVGVGGVGMALAARKGQRENSD